MGQYRYFHEGQFKEDPTTGTRCRTGQLNHQFVEQKFVGGVWVGIGSTDGVRYGDVAAAGRFREGMRDGDYVVDVEIEVAGFLLAEGDGWVNCGGVSGYWYSQYKDVLAVMPTEPSAFDKVNSNAWMKAMVDGGYYAKAELLDLFSADTEANSLINWKNPSGSHNPIKISTPTFTPYKGFAGDIASQGCLNLKYNPSVDADLIGEDNICVIMGYEGENVVQSYDCFGACNEDASTLRFNIRSGIGGYYGVTSRAGMNSETSGLPGVPPKGHMAASRSEHANFMYYFNNGQQFAAIGKNSAPLINLELYACGINYLGDAHAHPAQLRYLFIFSNLTSVEIYEVMRITDTYLKNYSANVGFMDSINSVQGIFINKGIVLNDYKKIGGGIVQEASVLYTTTDSAIVGNPCFQMWYTEYTDNLTHTDLCYAESKDGIHNWVRSNNPIPVLNQTRTFVMKHEGVYHAFSAYNHFTSPDNVLWTKIEDTSAIGANNISVTVDAGTWYMVYEVVSGAGYAVYLATSVNDGITWTNYVSNPVLALAGGSRSVSFLAKHSTNGKFYLWCHCADVATNPTDIKKYSSTDCITWTLVNDKEFPRTCSDEGVSVAGGAVGMIGGGGYEGQVADCHILEVNGKTYFYYSARVDQSVLQGTIKLAIAEKSMDEVMVNILSSELTS